MSETPERAPPAAANHDAAQPANADQAGAVGALGPELKRLLWQMAAGIVVVFGLLIGLGVVFREPLLDASRRFVEATGGWAVAVGYFLPDALLLPLPQETVTTFALLGGVPFWEIVFWGCLGTLLAGPVAYFFGSQLARLPRISALLARRGAKAHAMIVRYGPVGLAIGALTPLPYALTCYAAGALEMRWRTFLLVSLLRIPRVIFFLWLVELGALAIGQ